MNISLTDVCVHINESLDEDALESLEDKVRNEFGVVGIGRHKKRPHLMLVEYNPQATRSNDILWRFRSAGLHAQLIGL